MKLSVRRSPKRLLDLRFNGRRTELPGSGAKGDSTKSGGDRPTRRNKPAELCGDRNGSGGAFDGDRASAGADLRAARRVVVSAARSARRARGRALGGRGCAGKASSSGAS